MSLFSSHRWTHADCPFSHSIGSSLIGLTSFFGTIMKGLGASSRIFELLDAKPISVELGKGTVLPVTTPPRRLVFDDVHFAYPSRPGAEILRGVNLSIEPGGCKVRQSYITMLTFSLGRNHHLGRWRLGIRQVDSRQPLGSVLRPQLWTCALRRREHSLLHPRVVAPAHRHRSSRSRALLQHHCREQ